MDIRTLAGSNMDLGVATAALTAATQGGVVRTNLSNALSDPVIAGSDIEVYRVHALFLGGIDVDGIIEEFPSLSTAQVAGALRYAKIHPPGPEIKYPRIGLKRLLRNTGLAAIEKRLKRLKRLQRRK
jgi:uncharacterized protein (DUF433 family)